MPAPAAANSQCLRLAGVGSCGTVSRRKIARSAQTVGGLSYEDKDVLLLDFFVTDETTMRARVVTGDHPVWVAEFGWTRADASKRGAYP